MKRKWGITEKVFLILVIAVFAVFGGRKFFSIIRLKVMKHPRVCPQMRLSQLWQEERNKRQKKAAIRWIYGNIRMKYWKQRF